MGDYYAKNIWNNLLTSPDYSFTDSLIHLAIFEHLLNGKPSVDFSRVTTVTSVQWPCV